MIPLIRLPLVLCSIALLGACATLRSPTIEETPAIKAQTEIPENQLLDIGIVIFNPGIPDSRKTAEQEGIFTEVRKAEARYLPYALRTTLEDTGHWGAVRVVPSNMAAVDILVEGKIVTSTGETLSLDISVQDTSGQLWFTKEYTMQVGEEAYDELNLKDQDPFQPIYNSIANDILDARNRLSEKDINTLRNISELRFASDLSPHSFDTHLRSDEQQRYEISRLPAQDDPMLHRIRNIRERDYMLIDTLDVYYANFYRKMENPYRDWRKHSFEETQNLREVERSANRRLLLGAAALIAGLFGASQNSQFISTAGTVAVIGGAAIIKSGIDKRAESKIHAEALEELGESFQAEVEPLVVDVEGKTLTLTGSAETQYEQWRQLLRRIYAEETGFDPGDIQDPEATSEEGVSDPPDPRL